MGCVLCGSRFWGTICGGCSERLHGDGDGDSDGHSNDILRYTPYQWAHGRKVLKVAMVVLVDGRAEDGGKKATGKMQWSQSFTTTLNKGGSYRLC